MTNIRTHGFDNPSQLREYLLELEDDDLDTRMADEGVEAYDPHVALREVGWLRKEVADLREQATALKARDRSRHEGHHLLLQIAASVAAAFIARRMTRRLHRSRHT